MHEKWIVTNNKTAFDNLNREVKLHPLIARVVANRGITTKREADMFFNGTIDDMYSTMLMKDMKKAIDILKDAITNQKRIVIYGDYDCDGVCSTAILYKTLKLLGANFTYYIPNRESEGYGMNSDRIRTLKDEGAEVILTCDNGISAINEVKYAKELGMTVIVTDHHDIPYIEEDDNRIYVVPEADCVVDPKQLDCKYPFKDLCGAGVALKLSVELSREMNIDVPKDSDIYEFASLATVCDVVNLLDENRVIVKHGLKLINNTKNLGLKALIKECGLEEKTIGEYHYGFVLGPSINATGRLETADLSVELLITEDVNRAEELAKTLKKLNSDRQELTLESVEKVYSRLDKELLPQDKVILVYEPTIHESIAGIVAGRVREKYNMPTIIMTQGKDMPKGSGRSIEGYNMFEELNKCKEYISKFGGHPMAAGLSVEEANIPKLKKALNEKTTLTDDDLIPIIKIDSPLSINYLNFELIEDIEKLRPFGKANNSPLFAVKNLEVERVFFMGKDKNFMKFRFKINSASYIEGVNFDKYEEFKQNFSDKYGEERFLKLKDDGYGGFNMDIIYYPTINEFNGKTSIQLNIKNIRI